MQKFIKIVPYNPDWPKVFESEASKIKDFLGSSCLRVHHIGSTSVLGLAAKDELDILCVVNILSSSLRLQALNYLFKGEYNIPLRYFFSKNDSDLKVNLHVVENNHSFIALNLCFRDYLRSCKEAHESYRQLKKELALDSESSKKINSEFTKYNLGKNQFIKKILKQASFSEIGINFCNHTQEWEEYHRIRAEQIFVPNNIIYDPNHPTITDEKHFHFVLYNGVKIVSTAHIEFLNHEEAALRSLATDEIYKKQGFGTHMMNLLEKWLKNQNNTIIRMHARLSAQEFYKKLGYFEMPFNDRSISRDIIDLGKILS